MLMRCDDLRAKLLELNLPTAGRKHVLQDRLLAHFGIQDDDDNNDSDGVESVATTLDCPVQAAPISRSLFTLKNVEGSVSNFPGTGSPFIDQWIQELEECALTEQWSQLHSKQLLSSFAVRLTFATGILLRHHYVANLLLKYHLLRFIAS